MKTSPAPLFALVLAALLGATQAWAQATSGPALPSPLTAEAVASYARTHRAEIVAAHARALAAAERPAIVSALPDPMVMFSVDHLPFMLNGVDASVTYQQDFPLSGILRDRRTASEAAARRASIEVRRTELDVELDAERAYWMLVERRRVLAVVTEQLELARQLVSASTARYAAAQGAQSEVLRAQTEVAQLNGEVEATRAEIAGAESMLNAALARPAALPIPPTEPLSTFREPPTLGAVLQTAASRRPEIAAMRADVSRARAEVHVMQSMYWPMGFVRAGAAYTMLEGPGAMAMFGVSIPLWRGRLRAGVVEAEQMVSMADADVAAMRSMIEGEASGARAAVIAARTRALALRDEVVPLAEQGFTASLATYVSGQSQLVSVVDARRALAETRMALVMSTIAFELSWTRLERATGGVRADGVSQ